MAVSRDFRALLLSRRCGALSVHNIIQKTRTMAPKKKSPPKPAAALPSRRSSRSASLTGMDALDATATPAAPKSRARGASAAGLASRSSSRSRCKTPKMRTDNDGRSDQLTRQTFCYIHFLVWYITQIKDFFIFVVFEKISSLWRFLPRKTKSV